MSTTADFLKKERPWESDRPRVNLADVLPLDTPFSIQIDPSNLCNFRCQFCPTGHPELLKNFRGSKGQVMPWELFAKIIKDIQGFPQQLKTLSLHKDGEPLVNPRIVDMVRLVKSTGVSQKIVMLTNASLLTREMSKNLIDAGLDVLRVSVEHVHAEGYKELTRTFDNYQRIVDNVAAFSDEIKKSGRSVFLTAKLIDFGLSSQELQRFSDDFGPHCDEIGRTTAQGWSFSELFDFTLGTNPEVALDGVTPLQKKRMTCSYPFYTMAINANGVVSPCSDDWSHKAAIGDANTSSVVDIWNSPKMRDFRLMHLEGRRYDNPACRNCACIQGIAPDSDLDVARSKLLRIYRVGE